MKKLSLFLSLLSVPLLSHAQFNFTVNGGFEAGDTSQWADFPTANSTFVTTNDAATGSFAGDLFNQASGTSAVIKQANLGIGTITPGQNLTVSFDAKGEGVSGGVVFAEFFSEIDGGGVSASGILGGGPLALTNTYQNFTFNVVTGPDVSGGVTLQFAAVTGANIGSTSRLIVDNVAVTGVPEPSTYALVFGLAGIAFLLVRRRR